MFEVVDPVEDMPGAERMWVQAVSVNDGRYIGRVDNAPHAISTIKVDDDIEFGPEHVISVLDDDPRHALKVWVSRRSHVEDLRPQFVSRDESLNATDSGWCVMVGDETQEETDNPANVLVQPMGFVLDRWPELAPVFSTGTVQSEWKRNEASNSYVRVPTRTHSSAAVGEARNCR
ncbi:DUF2185 domain-containing protein [Kribbella sp. NPDC050459]|uniref:immunity protein Imm33 domain-containing protein n=1 Tax=Kribbella sp. NPDC050459 TaxID=3155785 RepID=UPI0033EB7314